MTRFRVYWLINVEKRRLYWEMDVPLRVADVDVIDIDEMGLFIESTNQKYGNTLRRLRADAGRSIQSRCSNDLLD